MAKIESIVRRPRIRSGLIGLCLLLKAASFVRAQYAPPIPLPPFGEGPQRKILDRYPHNPSLPPAFTIPVGPLGFSIPGENYLLRRQSLVTLDFLDEDRILFTFHVSTGLIPRDADDKTDGKEQRIRALVLALPGGKIESEATWTVPDRSRYLWMLKDGHFLLRGPEGLDEGNDQLKIAPYLHLPGQLLWIQMDPQQQFMITNSLEPATPTPSTGEPALPASDPPATTSPAATADGQKPGEQSVLVSRTIKRASGEVVRVSRFPWTFQTSDWPMNAEGYVERVHERGNQWLLRLTNYAGRDRVLAHLESSCLPQYSYVSESELLVATCDQNGGWSLQAMSSSGDSLWEKKTSTNAIWPLLVMTPGGLWVARETLLLKRSVDRYKRLLDAKDLQGQMVKVFEAASGKIVLEAPLTPILDGGGNVAISPSGKRVAILNAGAIQIFQLPPPSSARPTPPHSSPRD
jgi:hypothetical protein